MRIASTQNRHASDSDVGGTNKPAVKIIVCHGRMNAGSWMRVVLLAIAHGVCHAAEPAQADLRELEKLGDRSVEHSDAVSTLALKRLQLLAEEGVPEAQAQLGRLHARGEGVSQDDELAVLWWRKAADQGLAEAQNELGNAFKDGRGVAVDLKKASDWFRKAADQGIAVAQANLGTMYAKGMGVAKDSQQAVAWYRKAADQGLAWAELFLGDAYFLGIGVRADYRLAFDWYVKAEKQGYPDAQYALGVLYQRGAGVRKDNAEAVRYLAKAAQKGQQMAVEALEVVVANLSRVRLQADIRVRAQPVATARVLSSTTEREFAYILNRHEEWLEVYFKSGFTVGFISAEDMQFK